MITERGAVFFFVREEMPRTVNDLWDDFVSWDNLVGAYHDARKGKRYKPDVMRFHRHWEERILNIHNHLNWGSWQPSPFSSFPVYDPKPRTIEAPCFSDRVVHHALHRVVEPHFERRFIDHNYACRKGRGTHTCVASVQRMLHRAQAQWGNDVYVLQGDIARYFPSISHVRLMQQISRVIGDRRVLDVWWRIIAPGGDNGVGMPIGALTSQLGGNVYLDALDHYVTDQLGYGLYARYMDDWVIIAPGKADLWRLLAHLKQWLEDDLKLIINPKSTVYPARQGINFSGYRIWATHILPRKTNVKRARRRMRHLMREYRAGRVDAATVRSSWASFVGYLKYCESARIKQSILEDELLL